MAPDLRQLPQLTRRLRRGAAAALACALALLALLPSTAAAGVALAGRMGDKALLVIDGRNRVLAPGETVDGVRLLRWDGEAAVVEAQGQRLDLRLAAASQPPQGLAGTPGAGRRQIVIPASAGGHFLTDGAINGRAVRFMIDTGATLVALGRDEAERLGIDLRQARRVEAQTAGGKVPVQLVTLSRLRLGEVELTDVAAVVTPVAMPYVLLGNSVLARFQMRRENDLMRLDLR
jgi:aspartyl protease family protein